MKLILPLYQLEKPLGPGWSSPIGLMPLAGRTLLDHILFSAQKWLDFSPVFITTLAGSELFKQWAGTYPEVTFLAIDSPHTDLPKVLRQAGERWSSEQVLLVPGDAIIDANLGHLAHSDARVVGLVHATGPDDDPIDIDADRPAHNDLTGNHPTPAGMWWFQQGELLNRVLDGVDSAVPSEPMAVMMIRRLRDLNLPVAIRQADLVEPIRMDGDPAGQLLALNRRLLGFGRGSEDAIERSYGEDFTALTPVYLDDTAIIDSSVIGPYCSVGAAATVRDSVVRNSMIGPGALVENVVLDGAIIGAGATVDGVPQSLLVAEHSVRVSEAA